MTDLATWLLEQLAEDARNDQGGAADRNAKRQIVALFVPPSDGSYDRWLGDEVLRILALPYVDRPGYKEAWRP